jgi:catechol 2,3-dioxygenase-like lactoylglutathione lyase family enzyme
MSIHGSMHVIAVPNLATSCAFYRDVLGFEVKEMGDPGWRMLVSGACRIMVGECPDAVLDRAAQAVSEWSYMHHAATDTKIATAVLPPRATPHPTASMKRAMTEIATGHSYQTPGRAHSLVT